MAQVGLTVSSLRRARTIPRRKERQERTGASVWKTNAPEEPLNRQAEQLAGKATEGLPPLRLTDSTL